MSALAASPTIGTVGRNVEIERALEFIGALFGTQHAPAPKSGAVELSWSVATVAEVEGFAAAWGEPVTEHEITDIRGVRLVTGTAVNFPPGEDPAVTVHVTHLGGAA